MDIEDIEKMETSYLQTKISSQKSKLGIGSLT